MDDSHVYGTATRLCPEAPVPVFVPRYETSNPGGAGNVAANLRSLRPDWEIEHVFQTSRIIKRRFVDEASGHILLRVDEGDEVAAIDDNQLGCLLASNWDAIVISSYAKGFLRRDQMQRVFERHGITFLDTKFQLGDWSRRAFCVKINRKEWEAQPKGAEFDCQNLVVTLGKDGATLYEKGAKTFEDKGRPVAVRSVSGAGDSFQAALVINFLETSCLRSALMFANLASSIAVSRPGVVAVTQEDINGNNNREATFF